MFGGDVPPVPRPAKIWGADYIEKLSSKIWGWRPPPLPPPPAADPMKGALDVANVQVNIEQMFDSGWGNRPVEVENLEMAPIRKLGHI